MKLRYRAHGYLLVVSINVGSSHNIVSGRPFSVYFRWEPEDPYFGFMSTWDIKNNKDVWISPALRTYCEPPESYEIQNDCAIAHTDRKGLDYVIANVFKEWKKYHVDKKLAETQLQQLKHHTI